MPRKIKKENKSKEESNSIVKVATYPQAQSQKELSDTLLGFKIIEPIIPKTFQTPFNIPSKPGITEFKENMLPLIHSVLYSERQPSITYSNHLFFRALSKTNYSQEATNILSSLFRQFSEEIPSHIIKFNNSIEIGEYWENVISRTTNLTFLLYPLFGTTTDIFTNFINDAFLHNEDAYVTACQHAITSYNELRDTGDMTSLIPISNFLKSNVLFPKHFIPMFIQSIVNYLRPIINMEYEKPFSEYLTNSLEIISNELQNVQIFDHKNLLQTLEFQLHKLIYSDKLKEIYANDLRPSLNEHDSNSIIQCAKLSRETNTFQSFLHEISLLFEEEAIKCFKAKNPIQKLLNLHNSLIELCDKAFGPQSSRTIKVAFERGFNSEPENVARLLALSLNKIFINENVDIETLDKYFYLFKMLSLNDVFETYYTKLLTKRILSLKNFNIEAEYYIIKKFEAECNSDYTKRMESIINDYNNSNEIQKEFIGKYKEKNIKFAAIILSKDSCDFHYNPLIGPPKCLTKAFKLYTKIYKGNFKRRNVEWINSLARVTLKASNFPNLEKVHCSGDYASILMCFNVTRPQKLEKIAQKLGVNDENEIEKKLTVMETKKFGKILQSKNGEYSLNLGCNADKAVLNMGLAFHQLSMEDEVKISKVIAQNNDYQLDAAIMLVIKPNKSMDQEALKTNVSEVVNFRLDDDYFQRRLAILNKKEYVKIDPTGKVHYIP
ncbi:Cullin family protein [Histomonas meleagridis]|uniref:Cullin family protein n=1 Tax=Histomonas meleagridis TaxID=135588 RepID=UPI00355A24B0|nr:Cullin family protein [Histomonas meleagridis]KAH0798510.1 Cullin family protein [Histomonas meleagridis]